ncbi:copper chaperone PCu(A)C [Diaphorobacter aerolatus]|uniref:Copper chaperone PCu(A)C n=1 Tax=Diaphorobacter aerolatus TaxID=1288495 RepID=A0A7H0GN93_9BURK|nr:copper chaperone PCu(A)C [Diaphorobacter aerolatus]QNP49759.1 copper chaperone PCu(A)C [Diaphorobacter aerolatus]
MRHILSAVALSALTFVSTLSHAEVKVQDAWVRATVAQQKSTGAFMRITSTEPTTLVGVRTSAAPVSEVHEMKMEDNVMKMRKVDPGIAIKAGEALELKPGGYHVMLMDLSKAMAAGSQVPLTLVFKDAAGKESTVDVNAEVRALNANAPAAMDHGKHKH